MEKTYLTYGQTNAAVRKYLKDKYPSVNIKVRQDRYRGAIGMVIEVPALQGVKTADVRSEITELLDDESAGIIYNADFVECEYVKPEPKPVDEVTALKTEVERLRKALEVAANELEYTVEHNAGQTYTDLESNMRYVANRIRRELKSAS